MAPKSRKNTPPKDGDQRKAKPVSVRFKLRNRFYEVLVLLYCLRAAHKAANQTTVPNPEPPADANMSTSTLLPSFINKLGHICDSEKGGDTVSAFAVLQLPSGVVYAFASNHRSEAKLEATKIYVADLLQYLGSCSPEDLKRKKEVTSLVMRRVLTYVKNRVTVYAKKIHEQASACAQACQNEVEDVRELKETLRCLNILQVATEFAKESKPEDEKFSKASEELIHNIKDIYDGSLNGFADRPQHADTCWSELRHACGRLLSYHHGVNILILARTRWPALFTDFEIRAIPSFNRLQNPLVGNIQKNHSAESIIGRMTSEADKKMQLLEEVAELQVFDLDKTIEEECNKEEFKTSVHAEVTVHDWLVRNGYTHQSKFFEGIKYIGCSKPTCKLCQYYFEVYGFKVRPGHGNLYIKWRTPDVYEDEGVKAEKERERVMDKILSSVREETFRTISDKFSERKKHDSNTEPTKYMNKTAYDDSDHEDDDIKSTLGEAEDDSDIESSSPRTEPSAKLDNELPGLFDRVTIHDGAGYDDLDSEDGENGGAKI